MPRAAAAEAAALVLSGPAADEGFERWPRNPAVRSAAMLEFPQPHHLPCPECGATVARGEDERHECDDERWLDFRVFHLRDEVELFDSELTAWLDSPAGRFAAWLAERDR